MNTSAADEPILMAKRPQQRRSTGGSPRGAATAESQPQVPSRSPLWVVVLFANLMANGAFVAVYFSFPDLNKLYFVLILAGATLVPALLTAISLQRVSTIHDMLCEDPDVVCQDQDAMRRLRRIPWYGTKEIDRLQLVIYTVMCALRSIRREASGGRRTRVSAAASPRGVGGYADDDDFGGGDSDDNASFATAESIEDGPDQRLLGFRAVTAVAVGASGYSANGRVSAIGASSRASPSPFDPQRAALTGGSSGAVVPVGSYGAVSVGSYNGDTVSAITDDDDDRRSFGSVKSEPTSARIPSVSAASTAAKSHVSVASALSRAASGSASSAPANALYDPLNDNVHTTDWARAMASVPDPGGPIILQVLRNVKVGSSLSAVTLPVHILESRSMLEKMSDMFVHGDLISQVPLGLTPIDRLLRVAKWFLSAYHIRPPGAKKPYNPVLGEVFGCVFNPKDPAGRIRFLAEQVCHHPPVTALVSQSRSHQFFGVLHPRSKLASLNCAGSIIEGHGILTIDASSSSPARSTGAAAAASAASPSVAGQGHLRYSVTWPSAFVSGFTVGTMRLELGGQTVIKDLDSGLSIVIDFLRKGWVSGDYDRIKGSVLSPEGRPTEMKIEGVWHGEIYVREFDNRTLLLDASKYPAPRPIAVDVARDPLQSRAVWQHTTRALRDQNSEAAAAAKHQVEQDQRARRKELAERSELHETKFFTFKGGAASLAKHAHGTGGTGQGKSALWDPSWWSFAGADVMRDMEAACDNIATA